MSLVIIAPYVSHDKYFYGTKLYILLALHNIYQKQKTESVYMILKNNYSSFSQTHSFQKFSQQQQQKCCRQQIDDIIFLFLFMKQKIINISDYSCQV